MTLEDKAILKKIEFDELFYEQLLRDESQPWKIRSDAQDALRVLLRLRIYFLQKEQGLELSLN